MHIDRVSDAPFPPSCNDVCVLSSPFGFTPDIRTSVMRIVELRSLRPSAHRTLIVLVMMPGSQAFNSPDLVVTRFTAQLAKVVNVANWSDANRNRSDWAQGLPRSCESASRTILRTP